MKFKLSTYSYPFKIWNLYHNLQRSSFCFGEQRVELENERLRAVIDHAYNHVPYYNELFKKNNLTPNDIRSTEDLKYIPVLTKDILRERYSDLIADNGSNFKPYVIRTSGSTGSPLQLLQDKTTSIARFAFCWHAWKMAGYRPYIRWAQVDGMFVAQENTIWRYSPSLNSLQISALSLDSNSCDRIIKKLNEFQPRIIRGFPSALYFLALHAHQNHSEISLNLKSIITFSETLHVFQRDLLQEVFGCEVFDFYSSWEMVCIASDCEHHNMHHFFEVGALELLDKFDKPVPDGQTGEIVATGFHNRAMPLIRYKTRDLARRSRAPCSCGRSYDTLTGLDGRTEDMIVTPDGRHITAMGNVLKYSDGFNFAQIIQEDNETLRVLLVKNSDFSSASLAALEKEIRIRIGNQMKINFHLVNEITRTSNGKLRLVINKMAAGKS